MPRTLFLPVILMTLALGRPVVSSGQDVPTELDYVTRSIAEARADRLVEISTERLEISLFGATRRYSRPQAFHVLERFFDRYPPGSVTRGDGSGTDQGWFGSFSYEYDPGARPLLMFVRLRREGSRWMLTELIVREED